MPDTASLVQGTSILVNVLANDTGTGLTLTSVTTPADGTAVIQNGEVLYTPQASYVGPDAFGYTETDINGQTASGTVAVTVTTAVVAPSAVAQTGTVQQGQSIDINVLTGDTGSGITLTSVTTPQDGTAVIQNGEVLYTAPAAFVGSDSFSYTITGQTGLTATANVTVTVTETPPIANADTATVVEGGTVTINVLAVDIGNGLTLTSVGTPLHGTAAIQNGEVLYTAANGYVGPDSFSYGITDALAETAGNTVAVTVTSGTVKTPPPVAVPDTASVPQGTSILINVLANDTGTGLTLTSVTTPADGTAVIQNGEVLYTPQPNYAGPDAFSYTETDVDGQTASGNVAVTVTPVVVPVAVTQTGSVQQGQSIDIDVLAGDPGTGITLTGITQPQHGTAVIQNGEVLYTAPAAFVGADNFTYTITGETGLTSTGTVAVTVAEIPPVANPDTATVAAGSSVLVNVLAVDTGNGLTITSVGTPAHGTAAIQNGELLYTAAAGYAGNDAVSYVATDAAGETASATLTLTVTPVGAAAGDVHITTFDGLRYDFQAVGDFVLTRSTVPGDSFEIDIATIGERNAVSVTTEAAAVVGSDLVRFASGATPQIWIDGVLTTALTASHPSLLLAGGQLAELWPGTFELSWNTGETLTVTDVGAYLEYRGDASHDGAPGVRARPFGRRQRPGERFAAPRRQRHRSNAEWRRTSGHVRQRVAIDGGYRAGRGAASKHCPALGRAATGSVRGSAVHAIDRHGIRQFDARRAAAVQYSVANIGGGVASSAPRVFSPSSGGAVTAQVGSQALDQALTDAQPDGTAGSSDPAGTATPDSVPAPASSPTATAPVPPAADATEGVATDLGSRDIADALSGGESAQLAPETEAANPITEEPDLGGDLLELLVQWLCTGLLGPYYQPGGVPYRSLWMANGADGQWRIPGAPGSADETGVVSTHLTGLLRASARGARDDLLERRPGSGGGPIPLRGGNGRPDDGISVAAREQFSPAGRRAAGYAPGQWRHRPRPHRRADAGVRCAFGVDGRIDRSPCVVHQRRDRDLGGVLRRLQPGVARHHRCRGGRRTAGGLDNRLRHTGAYGRADRGHHHRSIARGASFRHRDADRSDSAGARRRRVRGDRGAQPEHRLGQRRGAGVAGDGGPASGRLRR